MVVASPATRRRGGDRGLQSPTFFWAIVSMVKNRVPKPRFSVRIGVDPQKVRDDSCQTRQ